jgi:hypothetical protein
MRAAQTMTRDMPGNEGRSGPSTSARVSLDMGRGGDHELFQAQIGERVTKLRAAVCFNL